VTARRTTRKGVTIKVRDHGRFSTLFAGPVWAVKPGIGVTGMPGMYERDLGGYLVPRDRADELMAYLEFIGHRIDLELAGW
jgi:hypothetical protein